MQFDDTIEFFEQQCAVCGNVIPQLRKGRLRRTCSNACRQKLYRMRKGGTKAKPPKASKKAPFSFADGLCPICGEEIRQKSRGRPRITCSVKCQKAYWRLMNPRCPVCGKRFRLMDSHNRRIFCSTTCEKHSTKLRKRFLRRQERAKKYQMPMDWLPKKGTGYRAEVMVKEEGEAPEVLWEREADPNYEDELYPWEQEREEEKARQEAARKAEDEARKAEKERQRLYREFFVEEWRWFGRDVDI